MSKKSNKRYTSPGTPAAPLSSVKVRPYSLADAASANAGGSPMMSYGGGGGGAAAAAATAAAEKQRATTASPSLNNYNIGGGGGDDYDDNSSFDTLLNRPLLTPNRSGTMSLLSPSKTINDGLTAMTETTVQKLELIWDELGYSPEDRADQVRDLLAQFKGISLQKIADERKVAKTYRLDIQENMGRIRQLSEALRTIVDPNLLVSTSGQPLTLIEQLSNTEAVLEGLEATAEAVKEQLKECRDYIIKAHDDLGIDVDRKWRDIDSDLTQKRKEEFIKKRNEMKEELSTRTTAVISFVRDCQELMDSIGIDADNYQEIDKRVAGSLIRSKDGSFIMANKGRRSETCVGIGSGVLEELRKRITALQKEKERRRVELKKMGGEIRDLWDKLHVPKEEQEAFIKNVVGLSDATFEKGEAELNRLRDLKSKMLGDLIKEARHNISVLWVQTNTPLDQQHKFEPFYVDDESLFTDELLDQHEKHVKMLDDRFEQMEPIIEVIALREEILRERMELEERQKDPGRLTQRSAALTQQLREEERMASRIKKKLPDLTEELQQMLHGWKEQNGEDFVYRDEVYFDVMDQQDKEWQQYKDEENLRKLKKKQKEKSKVENRFIPKTNNNRVHHHSSKAGSGNGRALLGDARGRENAGGRPRPNQEHDQRRKQQRPKHRGGSHDVPPVTKKPAGAAPTKRGIGNKQHSTRF